MRIFEASIEKTKEIKKDGRIGNMSYLKKHAELKENVVLDDGQESIRNQLEELIDDPSMNVIGLEGEWGSGKSTILKNLTKKFNKDVYSYEYDLWTHQEDNLRYSFSRGLLEDFYKKEIIQLEKYKKYKKDVDELIRCKESDGPTINYKMAGVIFAMLFLSIFSNIAEVLWKEQPFVYVIAILFFPLAIVSLLYLYDNKGDEKKKIAKKESKKKSKFLLNTVVLILSFIVIIDFVYGIGLRDFIQGILAFVNVDCPIWGFLYIQDIEDIIVFIFQTISLVFVSIFVIKMHRNTSDYIDSSFVRDALSLYNDKLVETSYSIDIQPRMEAVKSFMAKFFEESIKQDEKKVVIIFDNLDRLPVNKIREFWTFLQTFFVDNNFGVVTTIVAFERKTVENAWENGVGAAYLEKSLDFTIYVPLCSRMDLKIFFMDQWRNVFDNDEYDEEKKEAICKAGEHVFNLYHLLKKGSVSFSSRRGVIDAINEIKREKDKIHMFFTDEKVLGNIDKKTIEYPYELAAMYVFRKQCVNSMFSETVKEGIVKYYIDAFIGCRDWVSQFIPEKDDEGKKKCLQRVFNRLIQNNNQNANNMQSYYIIDHFKDGKLEYFFAEHQGHNLEEMKNDFDYIFLENFQRIRDDGNDIVNVVKSLLFCRMKKVSSAEDMEIKWGLLFNKIRNLKKWPNQLWCWNALIYNSSEYLNQTVWEKGVRIATERKCFITEELRSYYTTCENEYNGKICLPKGYLKRDFWPYSEHKMKKDGKLFFYDDRRKDEEGLVVNQLNEFDESDWIKSLQNFWCPGVIQYHRLKDKSRCNPGPLRGALKNFFQRGNVNPFEYQKGPCKHDKCYYDIWLELINVLSVDDMFELEKNIKRFFPEEYYAKLDAIIQDKKA